MPVLQRLIKESGDDAAAQKTMDLLKPVLSVETLTVLQLLGFNFKRAIGEPLTELLNQKIMSLARTLRCPGPSAGSGGRHADSVGRGSGVASNQARRQRSERWSATWKGQRECRRVVENATNDTWRNIRQELDRLHLVTLATTAGQVT